MLNNISQYWYQIMYHHDQSAWSIIISSILQDGGLKRLESPNSVESSTPQRQANPLYWLSQDQTYKLSFHKRNVFFMYSSMSSS